MAILPNPPQLPGAPSDKVQHAAAFATLAALVAIAYRSTSLMRLLASLSALGIVIECVQAIPALNRDRDPVDWIADTFAAALVLVAVGWWRTDRESHLGSNRLLGGVGASSRPTTPIRPKHS